MGAIAGPQMMVLMLTAMEHDLQAQINSQMDVQMILSTKSIFLGNAKANVYSQMTQAAGINTMPAGLQSQLAQIEAAERQLQTMEKTIEMKLKQLENQLKQVQQRKEAQEKMLDKNIQGAFTYGQR